MRSLKPSLLALLSTAAVALVVWTQRPTVVLAQPTATEAPTGFDDRSNGFTSQQQFEADRAVFEAVKLKADGLGPVYNGQSCAQCHQNPTSGGISQVTALRAGSVTAADIFVDHPGGSLIHDRAINANFQERLIPSNLARAIRTSLNTLGDGFVECIDDAMLMAIRDSQPPGMQGMFIEVPVLEAGGAPRGGRFGWKDQHASLVSFATDALLNEIGITTPLLPEDNSSNGLREVNGVPVDDGIPDPEDDGETVKALARFMRSTKAPPRDEVLAATLDAQLGSEVFSQVGCANCHVRDITTAPPGTVVNAGTFVVPPALGDKVIHPYSDFLLHFLGLEIADGIVHHNNQATRYWARTAPLWGLRTRNRYMHDGGSLTLHDAIIRHGGQAEPVVNEYLSLADSQKVLLFTFLNSL
jgi:CxxC motif-containing protein (DUF1111 family)